MYVWFFWWRRACIWNRLRVFDGVEHQSLA
jgi:hypothetical protein